MKSLVVNAHYFSAIVLFVLEAIIVFIADKKLRKTPYHCPTLLAMGLAVFVTLNIFIIEPVTVSLNRVEPFVTAVMENRLPSEPIVFYQIGPDAEDVKFMVAYGQPLQPVFIKSANQLVGYEGPAMFIAKKEVFEALPAEVKAQFKVVVTGNIGHRGCVAFEKI